MGKKDALIAGMGDRIRESASHRAPGVAMPGVQVAGVGGPNPKEDGVTRSKVAQIIRLDRIERDPNQPREEFDQAKLESLADSARTHGIIQPIAVRWDDAGREGQGVWRVVAGERRWRAAQIAQLETIPCTVLDRDFGPGELLALQVMENVLREDLKPIEQAKAYRTLMEVHRWSGNRLSKELGISQATVSQALSMLRLPEAVQGVVETGELPVSAAYAIAGKIDDPVTQQEVAARVVAEGMDRKQVAEVVDQAVREQPQAARSPAGKGRGAASKRPPAAPKPAPVVWDTDEFKLTLEFKTDKRRPTKQIAGDFVRWAKSQMEDTDAKLDQPAAGQGAEADAA